MSKITHFLAKVKHSHKDLWQIFLTSFAILYLELTLIRFIPAYVRYLGYFTNFILLGSFLGIGVGCLLRKSKFDFIPFCAPFLVGLILIVKFFKFELLITTTQVVYFTSNSGDSRVESFLLLPSIFIVVTLVFASLAQELGRLLNRTPALTAYSLDIIGSCSGIIVFTIGSFLSLPPLFWFGIFFAVYLLLLLSHKFWFASGVFFLILIQLILPTLDDLPTVWSPYQKVAPYSVSNPYREAGKADNHWRLYVNNISHQEMTLFDEIAPFYKLHYNVFPKNTFKNVLIVGSGAGQDVSVALRQQVETIDAVEIDPAIARLGKQLHPERPYSDKRVNLIVTDARSFLENTEKKYDLVIFALPDSTVLATSLTNLRLESYLFTEEAFEQVKKHLTPDGLFVLYNFYRELWLIDKISLMLSSAFSVDPYVVKYEDNLAVFMVGPTTETLVNSQPFILWKPKNELLPATDNWPFLYLKEATLPRIYLKSVGLISLIALVLVLFSTRGKFITNFSGDFFFLGAAFLLLETKSIVNFSLLFGSTWLVNSLVFLGILVSVLLAIWINHIWDIKRSQGWIIVLLIVLIAQYLFPLRLFLLPNIFIRYIAATGFFFAPIFMANVIFSNLFKRSRNRGDDFGANLIGAFFGGTVEYTSLVLGYHNLILIAIIFYAFAFIFIMRRFKSD